MLSFSSHILLFIILLFTEIASLIKSTEKIPGTILLICYAFAIIFAILSIFAFRKNYAFGSPKDQRKISIKSVSNGSQEIISYLITMVIPLAAASSSILSNSWLRLAVMLFIVVFTLTLYANTNLVVINPMLVIFGYNINKICFNYPESKIEIEGIMLSKKNVDLSSMADEPLVDMIDKNTFIIRMP